MTKFIFLLFTIFSIPTYSQVYDSMLESYTIRRINEIRKNPKSFIPVVEKEIEFLDYFNSFNDEEGGSFTMTTKTFKSDDNGDLVLIKEYSPENSFDLAKKECENLIKFLDTLTPIGTLTFDGDLYKGLTSTHANYLLDNSDSLDGKNLHLGPNGQSYTERVSEFGCCISENISRTGFDENSTIIFKNDDYKKIVDNVLLGLLLDSGLKDKGHRDNIFDTTKTKIAVAIRGSFHVQNFR